VYEKWESLTRVGRGFPEVALGKLGSRTGRSDRVGKSLHILKKCWGGGHVHKRKSVAIIKPRNRKPGFVMEIATKQKQGNRIGVKVN